MNNDKRNSSIKYIFKHIEILMFRQAVFIGGIAIADIKWHIRDKDDISSAVFTLHLIQAFETIAMYQFYHSYHPFPRKKGAFKTP